MIASGCNLGDEIVQIWQSPRGSLGACGTVPRWRQDSAFTVAKGETADKAGV